MTPYFFSSCHPETNLGRSYSKDKATPYKNLGRYYRVPFKSLLRVQIKWVSDCITYRFAIIKFEFLCPVPEDLLVGITVPPTPIGDIGRLIIAYANTF